MNLVITSALTHTVANTVNTLIPVVTAVGRL